MGKKIISHLIFDGLYHLFMVIWGMVHYCSSHINREIDSWLVVWNMVYFHPFSSYFPYLGNFIIPTDASFEGSLNHQADSFYHPRTSSAATTAAVLPGALGATPAVRRMRWSGALPRPFLGAPSARVSIGCYDTPPGSGV